MKGTAYLIFGACLLALCGCASSHAPGEKGTTTQPTTLQPIDPERVQARIMSFAERYMTSVADVYEQVEANCPSLDSRIMAQRCRLYAGLGAMGNAVNPHPVEGMMDMAMMTTIEVRISMRPWAKTMFGNDNANEITNVLQVQEATIWRIVADYLTPSQIDQLHVLVNHWIAQHPDQHFVAGARLAQIPTTSSGGSSNNDADAPTSLLSLIGVDPWQGLEPAVQQFKQSRILAERAFFYAQHMPMLVSWQTNLLYSQMLDNPETKRLLDNTTEVASSTKRIADATGPFSTSSSQLADSLERFLQQLPAQQAQLMDQLDKIVTTRQELLNRNAHDLMDVSIDRLYFRLRSLVFIVAGTVVAAMLAYRIIGSMLFKKAGLAVREKGNEVTTEGYEPADRPST